jgi:hypothetical protein
MLLTQLIAGVIAQKQAEKAVITPSRTPTPLRLSQDSRVTIQPMGLLLANGHGSIFGNVPLDNHRVVMVGSFELFNAAVRYYHVYLSGLEGGYLALAVNRANKLIETRLYRLYTEINPTSVDEWKFWLAEGQENLSDDDGYIGKLYANSLDVDGPVEYTRDWGGNAPRMDPVRPAEMLLDSNGNASRAYHRLMQYSRPLSGGNQIAEHLRVSAMAVNSTSPIGITFWLGIDVDPGEIQVFPATDAPVFPLS